MENLLTVAFEAHHAERNHHRRYQIMIGRDLLDDWTVAISYGRPGFKGREVRYAGKDENNLRAVIRRRLQRRLSAPRRIGCKYRLTKWDTAAGFNAHEWFPASMMVCF